MYNYTLYIVRFLYHSYSDKLELGIRNLKIALVEVSYIGL